MGRRAVITVDYLYTIGTTNKLTIEEPFEVSMDDGEVGFEFSELKALREMDYKIDWRPDTTFDELKNVLSKYAKGDEYFDIYPVKLDEQDVLAKSIIDGSVVLFHNMVAEIDIEVPDDYYGSDNELINQLYRVTEQVVNTYARVVFDVDVKLYDR
jgi:hypothetical protein